jgi:hypothetical protein
MPVEKRECQTVRVAFIEKDGKHVNLKNSDIPTRLVLYFMGVTIATSI